MTASGLRSSCEASWKKWRWPSKASSRRPSIPSKVSASSFISSSGPSRAMRRDRSVAWMSRATPVMRSTGRSTRPAANQPMPTPASALKATARSDQVRSSSRMRSFTSSSSARISAADGPLGDLDHALGRAHQPGEVEGLGHRLVGQRDRQPEVHARRSRPRPGRRRARRRARSAGPGSMPAHEGRRRARPTAAVGAGAVSVSVTARPAGGSPGRSRSRSGWGRRAEQPRACAAASRR